MIVFGPWQNHRLRNRDIMPLVALSTLYFPMILSLFTKVKRCQIYFTIAAYLHTVLLYIHSLNLIFRNRYHAILTLTLNRIGLNL